MAYSANIVDHIKKGATIYDIKDAYADERLQTIQGNASTEGSIAKAEADAKAYADNLATNIEDNIAINNGILEIFATSEQNNNGGSDQGNDGPPPEGGGFGG